MSGAFNIFALFLLVFKLANGTKTFTITAEDHNETNKTYCENCQEILDGYLNFVRSNATKSEALSVLIKMCVKYNDMHPIKCKGLMSLEIDTVLYIAKNKLSLDGKRVCAIHKQLFGCKDETMEEWEVKIDDGPIKIPSLNKSGSHLKILQLTDIHFDPLYTPGKNAKCDMPLCCQKDSGDPAKPEDGAGYWGDYNVCDIPWHTVEESIKFIKEQHKDIDFIYYTGDVVSHIGWKTSHRGNTADIQKLYRYFKESFGDLQIYPVLGNHEAHPQDLYAPEIVKNISQLSTQWLFDVVNAEWSAWLPKSTEESIKRGGFYTVLIKPKLRLISLNSNVAYIDNLWLLYDDVDPFGQLQWLADTLKTAEENGEFVHVIGHIPPGTVECHKNWNKQYVKIVKRYSHIIQGQFTGHTHEDEFRLFYDDDKKNVINIAYNGASLTNNIGYNPNYRIYDVNEDNYQIENFHEWIFNLTEANLNPNKPPDFYKLYSFVEDYKLGSLTYENVRKLVTKMDADPKLREQYYRYKIRDSDFLLPKGCDETCHNSMTCFIRSVDVEDTLRCSGY